LLALQRDERFPFLGGIRRAHDARLRAEQLLAA